jgi:hypothetical protein
MNEQSETNPFNMSRTLSNGIPIWKFVHSVAQGMHKKRSHRRKRVDNDEILDEHE